jgi:hypothetical protein
MNNYSKVLQSNNSDDYLITSGAAVSGSISINYDVNWLAPHICEQAKSITDENLQTIMSTLKKELTLRNLKKID